MASQGSKGTRTTGAARTPSQTTVNTSCQCGCCRNQPQPQPQLQFRPQPITTTTANKDKHNHHPTLPRPCVGTCVPGFSLSALWT